MRDLLAFPDTSRVWIYQGNEKFPEQDIGLVNMRVRAFAQEWVSHNVQLKATGGLLHDRFLVLVADESKAGASGCSIDTSVRFVKAMGEAYHIDFFDRLNFAYLEGEEVHLVHRNSLADLYGQERITDETLFFDNLVRNKGEFLARWVVPFGDSWMKRFV